MSLYDLGEDYPEIGDSMELTVCRRLYITELMQELSVSERMIVMLSAEGMTQKTIARIVHLSEDAVNDIVTQMRVRLHRLGFDAYDR